MSTLPLAIITLISIPLVGFALIAVSFMLDLLADAILAIFQ